MLYTHNKERITNAAEHRMPDFTAAQDCDRGEFVVGNTGGTAEGSSASR